MSAPLVTTKIKSFRHNFRLRSQTILEGGWEMESEVYWDLFCATGNPLIYMLYRSVGEAGGTETGQTQN